MDKQDAGREGVQYEVSGELMRLFYAPQTQAVIGQKVDGQVQMKVHAIGPPDGCLSKISIREYDPLEFFLDRECVPVLDHGDPWIREHRDLEQLNEYLSLFGLEVSIYEEDDNYELKVQIVPTKEPQDFCEHDPDWYGLQVCDVELMGGVGIVIDADVPCATCGTRKDIRFTIPEELGEWVEDDNGS